ncbi:hypothetical protein CsSME_00035939 [Camellia sinensis var. sinensis]
MALMDAIMDLQTLSIGTAIAMGGPAVALGGLLLWLIKGYVYDQKRRASNLPPLPEVPGLPVIGNLLQLKEKKPHKTFTRWAKTYGPVYSIRTGSNTIVVLNNTDVAKEVNKHPPLLRFSLFSQFQKCQRQFDLVIYNVTITLIYIPKHI